MYFGAPESYPSPDCKSSLNRGANKKGMFSMFFLKMKVENNHWNDFNESLR